MDQASDPGRPLEGRKLSMIVDQQRVAAEAGAIEALLAAWQSRWPESGFLVLLPEAEKDVVPAIQALSRKHRVPVLGAVFPALLDGGGFYGEGAWLICFDRMPGYVLASVREAGGLGRIVERLCELQAPVADGAATPTLFMIFDGMLPNVGSLVHGIFRRLGERVGYAGVCAGSETFQPMPCLFDGEAFIDGAMLGILLPGEPGAFVVRHDYPVSESLMRATSADGNRIDQIDNRPAFDVYQEIIRSEYGVALTRDNFYDYAVHYPFGLVTAADVLVRIPVAFGDDGSLFCVGEVAPNSLLRLLKAPAAGDNTCVADVAGSLNAGRGRTAQRSLLTFYCAGRRMHFGADAVGELEQLAQGTGASVLFGALSLGEIDQIDDLGVPRFHNAALVCAAF